MTTKLTPKQEKFCQCIASGMSLKDSYREAYDAENMNDSAVFVESSRLAKRDDITHRVRTLRKHLENRLENGVVSEIEESKRFLWGIVRDDTEKTENRLRAVDILNKMNSAYTAEDKAEDKADTIDHLDTDKLIQLVNTA